MNMDSQKVLSHLEEIYQSGRQEDGTFSRLAFTQGDLRGREVFMGYFRSLGIEPRIDAAGNIVARMEGNDPTLPPILLGSHLDTVPSGGKYDGVLGCVAGLGVCETLIAAGKKLDHPVEVIVFTDEEGARFGSGLLGSSAICGEVDAFGPDDLDVFGQPRDEVFASYGIKTATLAQAERPADSVHCFIELHVEQGASLYKNKIPVGVVTSIAGVKRYEVTVKGEANHSGSTLMEDRKDALVAAAQFIAAVPGIVKEHGKHYTVSTVGSIQVHPNSVNVVPGACKFSLEIRDQDEAVIALVEEKLKAKLAEICDGSVESHAIRQVLSHEPAPMCGWVRDAIKTACEQQGTVYSEMPSGAFHDSLVMTARFPTGMIFVPSRDGISHSPLEYTADEDIARGCNILMGAVLEVDKLSK